MDMDKCNKCGHQLDKKDYKKYGIKLIIAGIIMFPLLLVISYGTIIPYLMGIIFFIVGFFFLIKKERYFYYCKKCKLKFPYVKTETANSG
jgi:membrane-bound ClpP family serine protease